MNQYKGISSIYIENQIRKMAKMLLLMPEVFKIRLTQSLLHGDIVILVSIISLYCIVLWIKKPLFYRNVPGNISDVSTLQATIEELSSLGVKHAFALVDSGYFPEENILLLRNAKIDFLTRLPAGRKLYKNLILNHTDNLEYVNCTYQYGKRPLFIKKVKTY